MTYYRVKPECDQKPRIKHSKIATKHKEMDGIFVANELYTSRELKQFDITEEQGKILFEHVIIPKNKVYWSFGCRFAITE